jgi:hypothetical protein
MRSSLFRVNMIASVPVRKHAVPESAALESSAPIVTLAKHRFSRGFMVPKSAAAADSQYVRLQNHHTRLREFPSPTRILAGERP